MLTKNSTTTVYKTNKKNNRNNNKIRNNRRAYAPRGDALALFTATQIMPFKLYATLTYNDASAVRSNPGGSFLVYGMRINDDNDPDPLVLSGGLSNFKEVMQFYSFYRVLFTHIKWTINNLESFPLVAFIVLSQTNLAGTISSLSDAQNAYENDFRSKIVNISGKGGMDKATIQETKISIAALLGVGSQYRSDLAYAGNGLATPSVPLWANFIVYAPTGASLANGYVNTTILAMETEFFGRTNNRS